MPWRQLSVRELKIKNVLYEHLESFICKLEAMGVRMTVEEDAIFVEEQGDLKPVDIKTSPYPGFATGFTTTNDTIVVESKWPRKNH